MVFFYQAAAAQSVSAYWTLDDLIIQGITTVPLVVVVLLAIEAVFRFVRTPLLPTILRHPVWLVLVCVAILVISASVFGHFRGKGVYVEFTETHGDEVATVMDNSILRDVHLVGTTSRTAIFLRATQVKTALAGSEPRSYLGTLSCAAAEFRIGIPFVDLPWTTCEIPTANHPYQVLVMDRAQIVCHARASASESCADFPIRDDALVRWPDVIEGLDEQFGAVQRRIDEVEQEVVGAFGDGIHGVEEHMDRHYGRITDKLASLVPESD